ncbi:glycosyltransferase family 2 protein [Lactobacillus taiwanensis]|uniref:glycosyltransferase family 2 protein n=1 Tax=Lactobacillus taiwanensis TaxID=508451 RepID=UPI0024302086|nr:glycosyltransferase family 2 protein [Lactobacillus taiwanensis]
MGIFIYVLWVVLLIIWGKNTKSFLSKNISKIDPKYHLVVLVPAMNEEAVISRTIKQFLKSTAGLSQVEMVIIDDDSSDKTSSITKMVISQEKTDRVKLLERKKPNAQIGKGEALNWAYSRLISQNNYDPRYLIIEVMDADAYMTAKGYRKILQYFSLDENLDLLQTRVGMIKITNWLHILQDIEFALINDWIQNTRNIISNAAASGNGQCIRASAVDTNRPWGNALLEDFEFSTRFLLNGKKTLYAHDIVVFQEAVSHPLAFIRQRSRWVQGGLDCLVNYWRRIISNDNLNLRAKCEMTFYMILPIITLITGASHLVVLGFVSINAEGYWRLLVLLISINIIWCGYLGWKYWKLTLSKQYVLMASMLISFPIYNLLLYISIIIAFYKKIRGNSYWVKTTHGEDELKRKK